MSIFPIHIRFLPLLGICALLGCIATLLSPKSAIVLVLLLCFTVCLQYCRPFPFFKWIAWALLSSAIFASYTYGMLTIRQSAWQTPFPDSPVKLTLPIVGRQCETGRCTWMLQGEKGKITVNTPAIKCSVGDKLSFFAKLQKPHGYYNPGGFQAEQQAFLAGIVARGSTKEKPTCITESSLWFDMSLSTKQSFADWQETHLPSATMGIVQALTLGLKQNITEMQWQLFRLTGTAHLIAISGLHIGFLFLITTFFIKIILKRIPWIIMRFPVSIVAGWCSFFVAWLYAVISGWEIPAERAIAMLFCWLLAQTLRLPRASWLGFWLALLLVLASDPFAPLRAGFWLSFGAVAFLILLGYSRNKTALGWQDAVRCQGLLSLALIPLSVVWFGGFSVISPVANWIAIPWVSFGIVPLALIATLLQPFFTALSMGLYTLVDWQLQGLMLYLKYLSHFHWSYFEHTTSLLAILGALLGSVWLVLPRGFRYKPLALLLWIPFWVVPPVSAPKEGLRLVLLDVGQGLAMILQTPHHAILYDAGPKTPYRDAGESIVVPALRHYGIRYLDHIIISHSDMDHRGGLPAILKSMRYGTLITSGLDMPNRQPCMAGTSWRYDDVNFEVIHPKDGFSGKKNNGSCVVLVTIGSHRILLTGDIEKSIETQLAESLPPVDVLIVPHHGSKTSSSDAFLQALSPKQAWIPVGWHNVYHHPHSSVLARYEAAAIPVWRTDEKGAIILTLSAHHPLQEPVLWREKAFWWLKSDPG